MSTPMEPDRAGERVTPQTEVVLSAIELAEAVGISTDRLARLVRLGVVEPDASGTAAFTAATAARLGRMLRLRAELGVRLGDAGIIVDLLERLERLEAELNRIRSDSEG